MIEIDMNMPEHCGACPMRYDQWYCILHDGIPAHTIDMKNRPQWCPLKNESKMIDSLLAIIQTQSDEIDTLFDKLKEVVKELSRR